MKSLYIPVFRLIAGSLPVAFSLGVTGTCGIRTFFPVPLSGHWRTLLALLFSYEEDAA